jgi:transcriptional regulator with XRE-family HTH domain
MPTQETSQIKLTVGRNLAGARKARNLTQREIGEHLGITAADVSRWENGRFEPGPRYRQMLADLFFDGDVSALYRNGDEVAA